MSGIDEDQGMFGRADPLWAVKMAHWFHIGQH